MIKNLLRQTVATLLRWQARAILAKYKPKIIGVTGNIGKTSAKDAISLVISSVEATRKSEKSYNSEIGLPLSILGCPNAWGSFLGWFDNLITGLSLIFSRQPYPKWLILEIGADRPGDIKKVVKWLKLDIAVITALPTRPVHVEFFETREQLIDEKLSLLAAVKKGGAVVINHDDAAQKAIYHRLAEREVRIVSYGFGAGANFLAREPRLIYGGEGESKLPSGLNFVVEFANSSLPVNLSGVIGRHQIYAPLAGLACGYLLGVNLVRATEALAKYQPPPGRFRLIEGVKGSLIIDDTYNASPAALTEALKTLATLQVAGQKIAVLGDMLELGAQTPEAHQEAGAQAAEVCDVIITVGPRAKFINEAARQKKFPTRQLFHFNEARPAGKKLELLLKAGDVALVKGSQAVRLERAVEEAMAEPARKADLLCRQEPEWQKR